MDFLRLIRYKNLILLLFTQCLIHQGFLLALGIPVVLSPFQFFLLASATICIAAAGYIINDIYDIQADSINKPARSYIPSKYSQNRALNLFLILNTVGVGLGFWLSYSIDKSSFAVIFVLVSALLYVYAVFLKGIPVLGNLVISFLVAISILIVVIFDLIPLLQIYGRQYTAAIEVLRDYAIFAFLLNFLREIVKDIEDVDGDHAAGITTLPILLGRSRTAKITSVLGILYIFLLLGYIYLFLKENILTAVYLLVAVCLPLLFFSIQAWSAEKPQRFSQLSFYLKIIMVLGILSLAVLSISLKLM